MKGYRLAAAALAASMVLPIASASAAITFFGTNRAAFNAAAGSTTTETFNSFTTDTSFVSAPVDAGPFSLSVANTAIEQFGDNQVQATPFPADVQAYDIDGSSFALVNLQGTGAAATFTITFDAPTFAFGADFHSLGNASSPFFLDIAGNSIPVTGGTTGLSFIGVVSDTAFTTVTVRRPGQLGNEKFGMDNVSFSTAAVPEPAAWAMMISGFGLIGGAMRRRQSRVAIA